MKGAGVNNVLKELAFEESIEAHLLANGWASVGPAGYDRALGLEPTELIAFIRATQPDEWDQLVLKLGGEDKAAAKVADRVAKELTARGTVDVLRRETKMSGVSFRVAFFAPANDLTPQLRERYEANRLAVMRQLHHSESNPGDSLDLVLLVNGIPTASAELKNPTSGQTVAHAMAQYRTDRNPADLIFKHRVVVSFAVDPDAVFMTTALARARTRFLPFNQGSAGPGNPGGKGNPVNPSGYRTAYLWERVWARDAWLSLLGEFVHEEDVLDARGAKVGRRLLFPRFHQWDLVERLLAATRQDGPGVNRLAMHSAGSGKSNSIAWTAHRLSRLHTPGDQAAVSDRLRAAGLGANQPIFSKVVVITDRRVLDAQLQATVAGFHHTPGTIVAIDQDSQQLRAALEGNTARIIVTTLQKFPVVAESAGRVAGARFAVLVDEAHSSTGGQAMADLKKVLTGVDAADDAAVLSAATQAEAAFEARVSDATDLLEASMRARGRHERLSFFAFTATPKPKTLELFGEQVTLPGGEEQHRPFHVYSMRQAIEEGFILDVLANYTTYATYYRLANTEPEDPEVPVGKAAAALARYVSLHPTNLEQRAEIIIEHFRAKTAAKIGGRAKAMVVTRSRLHAVRMKQAIDVYIAKHGYDKGERPVRTLVAFSGSVEDPHGSGETFTEAAMNGFAETQLPARFAGDEFQVLVVAEKYQTGFDQPLLHTMYVDKRLAGVKAVQTLSRLNRTHAGKDDTFVLDFANSVEEIQEAFAPFFEGTAATPTDANLLYAQQRTLMDAGVIHPGEMAAAVQALLTGGAPNQAVINANLDPAVERFVGLDVEPRQQFRDTLVGYVRAYGFLAQVMSWTDRELEELYLYARMLATKLPAAPGEPLPVTDAVVLTHLRTEATAQEVDAGLDAGDDEPGVALPGDGAGPQNDPPRERLSVLIQTLNDKFGMNLTEADQIWFEQQLQVVLDSDEARVVAQNNDRDQFRIFLEEFATDAIIDRHEANGVLFNAFFERPGFRELFLEHLAVAYDELRQREAG